MRKALPLWLGLCWLLLQACKPEVKDVPATQVVVRIDADAEVRARLSALRVRVAGEQGGQWAQRSDARFARSDLAWPVDVVIAPQKESDAGSYFEVVVEALGDEEHVLVQVRALTTFVLRETRILALQLARCGANPLGFLCESDEGCYGPTCRTCVNARCEQTPVIAPESLAPFEPPAATDGGPDLSGDAGDAAQMQGMDMDAQVSPDGAHSEDTGDTGPVGCGDGYEPDGLGGCVDIDECARDLDDCDDDPEACVNLEGAGFRCECPSGYAGTGVGAEGCTDIDECEDGTHQCGALVACTNVAGSFQCGDCPPGYQPGATGDCEDINECLTNNGGCDTSPKAQCNNQIGAPNTCTCPPGYTGSGKGADGCVDILECASNNGGCDTSPMATCNEQVGAEPTCTCPSGYTGTGKGTNGCVNIDDCSPNPCLNGGTCKDGVNAFTCQCPSGFTGDRCEFEICGSLTIRTKADIDANKNCAEVRGDLNLLSGATDLTSQDFPHLRKVTGDLLVTSFGAQMPMFERITLQNLQTIEGALRIEGAGELRSMELPKLTTVGRAASPSRLRVISVPLKRLDLPMLTQIHGDAQLELANMLCSLNLRAVASVSGDVILQSMVNAPYSALHPLVNGAKGTVSAENIGCCTVLDTHQCDYESDWWVDFCGEPCQ